ncbi:MAG: ADP-ribosylglycohydrolase family protein [Pseudomonadota bacterium]
MQAITTEERYRGSLLGLAAGDALGTTLEFKPPGSFEPITDMVGGGPFSLKPGQWTDDTSMALCLAESLVRRQGFNAADQMHLYLRWAREGYWSSTGWCFDIGNTVNAALDRFGRTDDPFAGSTDPLSAGNGSLMRLAPIPLAFHGCPELAIEKAAAMSRTTHAVAEAVDACRFYCGLICMALGGASKRDIFEPLAHPVLLSWPAGELAPKIECVAQGSYREKKPPQIRGTGYVVDSLEAALWAFWITDNFRDGALAAANLGEDADTTAAIYGQLAGAFYGVQGLPDSWLQCLTLADLIEVLASQLLQLALQLEAQ